MQVWELLFNGQVNGASFNTFMGKAAEKGVAQQLCTPAVTLAEHLALCSSAPLLLPNLYAHSEP